MNSISCSALVRFFPPLLRLRASLPVILLALGFLSACHAGSTGDPGSSLKWVGTWGTAPQLVEPGNNPPSPGLSNNTLRQIVRVSIGGDSVRVRFSNEFSTTPVSFLAVHCAVSKGGGTIDSTTDRALSFGGKSEITIAAGAAVTSDPFQFALQPRMDIAITICFSNSPTGLTGHPGSRTTSYLLTGNAVSRVDFSGAVTTDHWYSINAIDVLGPASAASVAILGNSITDGRGSTTNMQNRWPDMLSESLLKDSSTLHVGVLNMGIGGNAVLSGGLGPTGVSRFERDILGQHGVRWAIVFTGVNDIGGVRSANAATATSANLIAAYQQMVVKAHAKDIRVYGGTILPFNGHSYYNQYSELCRSTVNQWIRTRGNFDACIDFDNVMRNPQDTTRLGCATFQNDGLHPDAAAYKTMGESIDRNLFVEADPSLGVNSRETIDGYALGQNYPNPFNPKTRVRYSVPTQSGRDGQMPGISEVRLVVYDLLGREVATLVNETQQAGKYEVAFDGAGLASGIYVYQITAGSFVQARKMLLTR